MSITTVTRRWMVGLVTAAGILAALALVATTSGASPPGRAHRDIDVFIGQGFLHKVDEPPAGKNPFDLSPGDTLLHNDPVLDPTTGEKIGSAVTRVHAVRSLDGGDALILLDCTVRLPGGNLVFSGGEPVSKVQTGAHYPLTGGTGDYTGNNGEVVITAHQLAEQAGFLAEFDFTRP